MTEDGEEQLQLSASTFAALQEFYNEEAVREVNAKAALEASADIDKDLDINAFAEDWNLSQFWYDADTAKTYADECMRAAGEAGSIACISAPSVYFAIRKHHPETKCTVKLFEYDQRFAPASGSDFVFYDYKSPLKIPKELANSFDVVLADPPFIADECLTSTAVTIKYVSKDAGQLILCTGERMTDMAKRLLDLNKCKFEPRHKNNLANEFACFANYDFDSNVKPLS